jgi:membrane protein
VGLLRALRVPLSWKDVLRRIVQAATADNLLGWSAELAYYFFLALFPALLFFVALASFFPIHNFMDQILGALARFAPAEVLTLVRDQLLQISQNNNGGLLTLGIFGTLWSASSGMSSAMTTLNQAYHVKDGRSWVRVRITAVWLTIALALFILVSFALVLVGPTIIDRVADWIHLGKAFAWTWKILQWPLVFALVVTGVGIVYYVAPDVKQEWVWITPGAVFATLVWLLISLGFKWYVSTFANYQKTYGAIGAVIVALLWFYVSGLAILVGAQMNAVLEHASPEGKDPGEKVAGEKEKFAANTPSPARRRTMPPVAATRTHPRPSEMIVGILAIGIELAALIRSVRRRVHLP